MVIDEPLVLRLVFMHDVYSTSSEEETVTKPNVVHDTVAHIQPHIYRHETPQPKPYHQPVAYRQPQQYEIEIEVAVEPSESDHDQDEEVTMVCDLY